MEKKKGGGGGGGGGEVVGKRVRLVVVEVEE
jgi:hypothetical protein